MRDIAVESPRRFRRCVHAVAVNRAPTPCVAKQMQFSTRQLSEDRMPEKETLERARRDRAQGKSPSTQAGEFVREEIHHVREGKHGARSTEQAIAIGLSKARRAGVRIPARGKAAARKRTARKRTARKRATVRRAVRSSPKRKRAVRRALKRESRSAASRRSLARFARKAARRRSAASRRASARKAARTRKRTSR